MLPACNRGAGANVHTPDVCLTTPPRPPVPKVYVDRAANVTAVGFVPTVFLCGLNAHNLGTVLATSTGDEQGNAHWTRLGWSKYVQGNPIVFVGKLPGETLTCRAIGNRGNAPNGLVAVPSAVNVFYTSLETATAGEPVVLPFTGVEASRLVRSRRDPATAMLSIAVTKIGPSVNLLVKRAIAQAGTVDSVELDISGNPGGDLDAAIRLLEVFVEPGSIGAILVDPDGHRTTKRTRCQPVYRGALVVRVDGSTGSAAEVVAAALKALGRALVVGTRTWGKGTVEMYRNGERTTVATVLDPDGRRIDGVGVTPHG